jgi:hypothetical protein
LYKALGFKLLQRVQRGLADLSSHAVAVRYMIENKAKTIVGWREWLSLPDLGIAAIKAKVDTGARSSAIHAYSVEVVTEGEQEFAIFQVHPYQDDISNSVTCRAPIVDRRIVRDSGGHEEERLFISTSVAFMGKIWEAEFSLTNRENMAFRMLLGRTSIIGGGLVVDPALSFTQGEELAAQKFAASQR